MASLFGRSRRDELLEAARRQAIGPAPRVLGFDNRGSTIYSWDANDPSQAVAKVKELSPAEEKATIEAIHTAFDTASDRALAEANEILGRKDNSVKAAQYAVLIKMGFASSKTLVDCSNASKEVKRSEEEAKLVAEYRQKYPFNKFIAPRHVDEICKKYNIVLAPTNRFKGEVPAKNIEEMAAFKLKEEDKLVVQYNVTTRTGGGIMACNSAEQYFSRNEFHKKADEPVSDGYYRYTVPEMMICAPLKDIQTYQGETIVNGVLQHAPAPKDPIVLQVVRGGFLIVTKWGLEASDPLVKNEEFEN